MSRFSEPLDSGAISNRQLGANHYPSFSPCRVGGIEHKGTASGPRLL